jgi:hypothetical protein
VGTPRKRWLDEIEAELETDGVERLEKRSRE